MAEQLAKLIVDIEGRTTRLNTAMKNAEGRAEKSASRIKSVFNTQLSSIGAGLGTLFGGYALISGLRRGVSAMLDFEKGMRQVNTIIRINEDEFQQLSKDVLELSTRLGTPTSDLTGAMYQAVSAGIAVKDSLLFMETATKGAIAGITSTETAVDGLTTVLNAFGIEASDVTKVSDLMFTTIRLGKTTAEELASSYSIASSLASVAGITFKELSAAIASLTVLGVPTSVAMTQLRGVIIALTKNLGDGWRETYTFQEGLERMLEIAEGSQNKLKKMIGRIEGVNAVLGLTGKNAEIFTRNLKEMDKSAGATDEAFAEMEKGISRKLEKIGQFITNNLIVALNEVADILLIWGERIDAIANSGALKTLLEFATAIGGLAPAFIGQGSQIKASEQFEKLTDQVGEAEALRIMYGHILEDTKDINVEMEKYRVATGKGLAHIELLARALQNLDDIDIQEPDGLKNMFKEVKEGKGTIDRIVENIKNAKTEFSGFQDITDRGLFQSMLDDLDVMEQILFGVVNKTERVNKEVKNIEDVKADKLVKTLLESVEAVDAIDLTMLAFPKVSADLLFESLRNSLGEAEALKAILEKFPEYQIKGKEKIDRQIQYTRFIGGGQGLGAEIYEGIQKKLKKVKVPLTLKQKIQDIVGNLDLAESRVGDVEKAIEKLEELKIDVELKNLPEVMAELIRLQEALDVTSKMQERADKLKEEKKYIEDIITADDKLRRQIELIDNALRTHVGNEQDILFLENARLEVLKKIREEMEKTKPPEPPSFEELGQIDFVFKSVDTTGLEQPLKEIKERINDERIPITSFLSPEGEQPEDLELPPELEAYNKKLEEYWKNMETSAGNIDQKFISILNAGATLSNILDVGAHTFIGVLLSGLNTANQIANSIFGIISAFTGGGAGGLLGFLFRPSTAVATVTSPAYARGGEFTVPQGFPNDSYPMRVESGERVEITPRNKKTEKEILKERLQKIESERGIANSIVSAITNTKNKITNVISDVKEGNALARSEITNLGGDSIRYAHELRFNNAKISSYDSDMEKTYNNIRNTTYGNRVTTFPKFQSGGTFTVPRGYPSDTFPILLTSGEKVDITPENKIPNNERVLKQIASGINELISKSGGEIGDIEIPLYMDSTLVTRGVLKKQNSFIRQGIDLTDF